MQFFFPLAIGEEQAERVYKRILEHIEHKGYTVTSTRIYKLIYQQGVELLTETVGAPSENGEIVLAIFKNDASYLVCSYSQGAVWGEPKVIWFQTVKAVEFFEP